MAGAADGEEHTVCKIRGFTLTYSASKSINFETMKTLVTAFVESGGQEVVYASMPKIVRLKDHRVVTREEQKAYRARANKIFAFSGMTMQLSGEI